MSGIIEAGVAYAIMLGLLFQFTSNLLNELASLKAKLDSLGSASEEE